jgi:hypothetical protein
MLHLVEDIVVAPEDTRRYLEHFERGFLPRARARGQELVACWHTPVDIGEDVHILIVWAVRDWDHWVELRWGLVRDPTLDAWLEEAGPLRKPGSTWRFYTPAAFSPLPPPGVLGDTQE